MRQLLCFLCVGALFLWPGKGLRADEVVLLQGTVLKGTIIQRDSSSVVLQHPVLGRLRIPLARIKAVKTPQSGDTRVRGTVLWKSALNVGYSGLWGNSEITTISVGFSLNRNTMWVDEWTLKASAATIINAGVTEEQKAAASLRYGYSFSKPLYGFLMAAVEHDRIALVRARTTATGGLGYWLFDIPRVLKFMFELGGGYRHTWEWSDTETSEAIFSLRAFFESAVSKHYTLGIDSYFLPSVSSLTRYILTAKPYLRIKLAAKFSLQFEYLLAYDSAPAAGASKQDDAVSVKLRWDF